MPRRCAFQLFVLVTLPVGIAAQSASSLARGSQLVKDRKYAEARQVLEPVARAEPKNAAAAYWLARARIGTEDVDGSRDLLERAVALAPNEGEYHRWLGQVYCNQAQHASVFSKVGLAKKCRAELERAVALEPNDVEARTTLAGFYSQAPGIVGGSKEKAAEQVAAIKRLDPYRGGFIQATLENGSGQQDQAIATMRQLAAAYPDSASPVAQVASLATQRKQPDQAFAALDAFLKRHPHDPVALYALGRTAAVTGQRLDDGERALREYVGGPGAPGMPAGSPHWRLGQILETRGRKDEARKEYETAVRLEPKNAEMRKSLERLGR